MNLYALFAAASLAGVLTSAFVGYRVGYDKAELKWRKEIARVQETADIDRKTLQNYANWLGRKYVLVRTERDRTRRALTEQLRRWERESSAANTVCLDANGVRLYNDFARGRFEGRTSSSNGDGALPGRVTTAKGSDQRGDSE